MKRKVKFAEKWAGPVLLADLCGASAQQQPTRSLILEIVCMNCILYTECIYLPIYRNVWAYKRIHKCIYVCVCAYHKHTQVYVHAKYM